MKKTHRILAASALLLAASSASAQLPAIEITARATRMEVTGSSDRFVDLEQDFTAEFEPETGFGLGVNVFLSDSVSVETTASLVEPDARITLFAGDGPTSLFPIEMIPVTIGLQYHFRPVRWLDVYVGGGGAYILFEDIDDLGDLALQDVGSIEIDDQAGFMVNVGATFELRGSLGLNVDAKYLAVEPDATVSFVRGDFVADRRVDFNPVMLSAGVSWRF